VKDYRVISFGIGESVSICCADIGSRTDIGSSRSRASDIKPVDIKPVKEIYPDFPRNSIASHLRRRDREAQDLLYIIKQNVVKIIGVVAIAPLIIPIEIPPFALAKRTASIDLKTSKRYSPRYLNRTLEFLYRDVRVEQIIHWDADLVYYYRKQEPEEFQPIVFVLIQIKKGRHT